MLAALVSFGGGLLVLCLLLALLPGMRAGVGSLRTALAAGSLRRWHLLGGMAGALMIASQAVTVGVLGVALLTLGVVAGQTVGSLVVDRVGLGPAGMRPLTARRVAGAVLMLVAIGVTVGGQVASAGGGTWLLLMPVAAGVGVAVQQAINGRVGAAARNAMTATLVNFVVGTVALAAAWLVSLSLRGGPSGRPGSPVLYLGGLVGICFIALAAFVVRWIGVLLLGLASIVGQLAGSVLLDLLAPTRAGGVQAGTLVGIALATVAVAVAAAPRPGRTPSRRATPALRE